MTSAKLDLEGYRMADDFRSGKWPELKDDGGGPQWAATWSALIRKLEKLCPGHTTSEYEAALEKGFRDSR